MTDPRTDLPSPQAPNFNQRVRESLMTYLGKQGNLLDRGLTLRDLVANGLLRLPDGYSVRPGGGLPPLLPGGKIERPEIDLTPPPTPSGFAVSAAISNIFVEHDAPTFRQGGGYLRTRVYGVTHTTGPLPVFNDAVEITQFTGRFHAHPSNPATRWHLWVKWETKAEVLSPSPAGGTHGLVTTTGQNVQRLLDALTGQIRESQLFADLGSRINLIDGPAGLPGSVAQRVAAEAQARAEQLFIADRNQRAHAEMLAESVLRNTVAVDLERKGSGEALAVARNELTTRIIEGLSAEAAQRTALQAELNNNIAAVATETVARVTADSAIVQNVTRLDAETAANRAAITSEAGARTTAVSAEAAARESLAAQMRGGYAGNDLALVTSGLIHQERTARVSQDQALAQQIMLLSAGAGEQFDWATIWYFDTGAEGWTGNGAPAAVNGWLRPANQASGAFVVSPTGVAVNATTHPQVRLRVRRHGAPVFAGVMWWRAAGDAGWTEPRSVALPAPTFDANGIGLITVTPTEWSGVIDQIRIDLSSAQTPTDWFELDWVAMGRPSPGASSAQLLQESTARAAADTALGHRIDLVQAATDTVNSQLTAAIQTETTARTNADTALTGQVTTLQAGLTGLGGDVGALQSVVNTQGQALAQAAGTNASLTHEVASVRRAADVEAEAILRNAIGGNQSRRIAQDALAFARTELSTRIEAGLLAEATARQTLLAQMEGANTAQTAALQTESSTRATADSALSQQLTTLAATVTDNNTAQTAALQVESQARASVDGGLLAQFTVKTDVNGYVSGFGLASSANNSVPTSAFVVRADSFSIANPAGPSIAPAMPFIVRTTPTTINGVAVPAGVYMTDTFVQNGTITNAKIGNLAVDTAKIADLSVSTAKITAAAITQAKIANAAIGTAQIQNAAITQAQIANAAIGTAQIQNAAITQAQIANAAIGSAQIQNASIIDAHIQNLSASKLTAGAIGVGQHISSTNFNPNVSGWVIRSDGSAEFNGVVISRNQILAQGVHLPGHVNFNVGKPPAGFAATGPFFINTHTPISAWEGGSAPLVGLASVGRPTPTPWMHAGNASFEESRWGYTTEVLPATAWHGPATIFLKVTLWSVGMSHTAQMQITWVLYRTT